MGVDGQKLIVLHGKVDGDDGLGSQHLRLQLHELLHRINRGEQHVYQVESDLIPSTMQVQYCSCFERNVSAALQINKAFLES